MKRYLALPLLAVWLLCCGFGPNQKPPLGAQLNWSHPLAQGLVGAWLMNEGSGSVVNNSFGSYGFLSGPILSGIGLEFGSSVSQKYVNLLNTDTGLLDWSTSSRFTVLTRAVLITNPGATDFPTILSKRPSDANYQYQLRISGSSSDALSILATGGSRNSTLIPPLNAPNNIGFASDGTSFYFYLNGVVQTTAVQTITHKTGNVYIGGASDTQEHNWDGSIYYVFVYNTLLSKSQIDSFFLNPFSMYQRPALSKAYLNFGSGGTPPTSTPARRKAIIIGKIGRDDIIAWADDYTTSKVGNN